MPDDAEWLTWEEAAALVGCPVPTIDWHKRQGRIVSRGRVHRSLQRESVEAFAAWYRARAVRLAEQKAAGERARERMRRERAAAPRARRPTPEPPDPTGWVTTREAAARLGLAPGYVSTSVGNGRLPGVVHHGQGWMRDADVDQLAAERARWVSYADAARIVGVGVTTISRYVTAGRLEQRDVTNRALPSISRASAEALAVGLAAVRAEQATRAEEHRRRRAGNITPPDDGQVWLSLATVAVLAGLSTKRVNQLVNAGRLQATKKGTRWWVLRDHAEQFAAARALRDRVGG